MDSEEVANLYWLDIRHKTMVDAEGRVPKLPIQVSWLVLATVFLGLVSIWFGWHLRSLLLLRDQTVVKGKVIAIKENNDDEGEITYDVDFQYSFGSKLLYGNETLSQQSGRGLRVGSGIGVTYAKKDPSIAVIDRGAPERAIWWSVAVTAGLFVIWVATIFNTRKRLRLRSRGRVSMGEIVRTSVTENEGSTNVRIYYKANFARGAFATGHGDSTGADVPEVGRRIPVLIADARTHIAL